MKKYYTYFWCILSICLYTPLYAQQSIIKIKVFDAATQQPLESANVYWRDTAIGTSTDSNGLALLSRIENQTAILVDYLGYKSDTIIIKQKTGFYIAHLHPSVMLNTVEINAKKQSNFISSLETKKMEKITLDELKKAACCNLSESFQTNASIDVNYQNAVTGAKEIKLLGLSGLYVQNLIEGLPYMRRYSYAFGIDQLPSPWINAISISKGIPSVKNGYEGITGSMSVQLKNGFNDKNKLYFDLFGNSDSRIETNLIIHHKINEHLSTSLMFNGAFRPMNMDRNKDGFLDNPKIKQYNFLNSWNIHRPDKRVEGQYYFKAISENRQSGQTEAHIQHQTGTIPLYTVAIQTKRFEAFTKTGFLLKKHDASIGTQFSGVYHQQESQYGLINYNVRQASFTGNLLYQTDIKNEDHLMVTGMSFTYDNLRQQLDSTRQFTALQLPGIFAEYTYKHGERITLIAAMRLDYSKQTSLQYAPRLHARFDLDKKQNTTLRLSAGRGYRVADLLSENQSLLASSRIFDFQSNSVIEAAWNYGFSLHQKYKLKKREGSFTVDFFRTDFTAQNTVDIENENGLTTVYPKQGKSFSNSLMAEWNMEIAKGWDIKIAYKWEDVRMTYHNILLQKALHFIHRGLFSTSYKIPSNKVQFDLIMPIYGKSRMPNSFAENAVNKLSKPYVLLNFQILTKFKIGEFFAGIENMTNYKQKHPILGSPGTSYFDTYQVYAPVSGITGYGGFRIFIN